MKKLITHTAQKIGSAPGTLTYTGSQAEIPVTLGYWENSAAKVSDFIKLTTNELPNLKSENQWLNIQGLHDLNLLKRLGKEFGIHDLFLEDILNSSQQPKVEMIEDCLFISLKALTIDDNQEIKAHTISFLVRENTLFSFSEFPEDKWLTPIIKRLKKPNSKIQQKNIYYLLYALIDVLVDQHLFVLESLGNRIQDIDQTIFENPDTTKLDELYQLKKQLLYLTKQTSPVADLIHKIPAEISEDDWESVRIYFDDLLDHGIQVREIARTYTEAINNLFDLYFSLVNLRMNRTIQALTVITVVFLPLSLLAGIYGMNFNYMPGLLAPQAFWIMMAGMLLLSGSILWFLKHKNWF